MERLTRRNKDGSVSSSLNCPNGCIYFNCSMEEGQCCYHECEAEYMSKLADYEDAEEQGRLFILPLVVGDIAYTFRTYKGITHVQPGIVSEVSFNKDMQLYYVVRGIGRGILGEKVFPTEEEAEAKLKSLRGY